MVAFRCAQKLRPSNFPLCGVLCVFRSAKVSRSIHKTIKGVFGGQSKSKMNHMIEENEPDVEELGRKYEFKNEEKAKRKLLKQSKKIDK
jgi:hypothetical protein